MRNRTDYEWDIEETDGFESEDADILDHTFAPELSQFHHARLSAALKRADNFRLVLCINKGNDTDGLQDRAWAYVEEDGTLPEFFADAWGGTTSYRVPTKFHRELERAVRGRHAQAA